MTLLFLWCLLVKMALDTTTAKDLLLHWCKQEERRGEEAVECADIVLKSSPGLFGDQVWDVYEYVAMSALDCYRPDMVKYCLGKLVERFPSSVRVKRMQGMALEAEGKAKEAADLYEELLVTDPANQAVKKRLVALHKDAENWDGAIKQLTLYLEVFMTDYEAWAELASLYIHVGRFKQALFCVEELILSHPTTDAYLVLLAEICYADKRPDLARSYCAKACELNKKNLRALYTLFMACLSYSGPNQGDNQDLGQWARERIVEQYTDTDMADLVEASLQSLWPLGQ